MQKYSYKLVDIGTYAVMSYQGDEEYVKVPEIYNGKPVTIIGDKLFAGHSEITSVKLPEAVTDMGEFVFDGCENLRTIRLPASLDTLWGHTFAYSGIEEIELPDSLTRIPPFAFKGCRKLKKVVCGKNMKKINAWAFAGCEKLEEMNCPPDADVSPRAFEERDPVS